MGGCYNEEIKLIICRVCKIEKEESCFQFRKDTGKYRTNCTECKRGSERLVRSDKLSNDHEFKELERLRIRGFRAKQSPEKRAENSAKDLVRYHEKMAHEKELFKKTHGVSKESAKSKAMHDKFIRDSVQVHGNKYGYERVEYQSNLTKVEIHCRACDRYFLQTPKQHRRGTGCWVCAKITIGNAHRKSKEDFLAEVFSVHGNKFDCSRVDYKNNNTKVEIGCVTHGFVMVSPAQLISSSEGCPKCSTFGYNTGKEGSLYVLTCEDITKVGITNRGVSRRVAEINRSFGRTFKEVFSIKGCGEKIAELERNILKFLMSKYEQPTELFQGSTECFHDVNLSELINIIEREYKCLRLMQVPR